MKTKLINVWKLQGKAWQQYYWLKHLDEGKKLQGASTRSRTLRTVRPSSDKLQFWVSWRHPQLISRPHIYWKLGFLILQEKIITNKINLLLKNIYN